MAKTLEQLKKEWAVLLQAMLPQGQGGAQTEIKFVVVNAGESSGSEGGPMAQPEEKAPPEETPAEPPAPEGPHPFLGAIAEFAKDFAEQLGFAPQPILLKPNSSNGWMAESLAPALVTGIVGGPATPAENGPEPTESTISTLQPSEPDVPAPIIVSEETAKALGMDKLKKAAATCAKPKAHKPSIHDLGKIKWYAWLDGEGKSLGLWETPKALLQHFGAPITDVPCRQVLAWAKKNPEKAETIRVILEESGGPSLSLLEAVHILDNKKEKK